MTTTCPCCGGETERPFVVDLNANVISCGGNRVALRPQIAEMLYALARDYPKTVRYEKLINSVWGMNEPQCPREQLRVLASYARADLASIGLRIGCRPKVGFFLTMDSPQHGAGLKLAVKSDRRARVAA
jgi:DNA-binding winged helix-turn-helix (wHTH) protein